MERKFKVGDRVNNYRYGDGTIIGIGESEAPYFVEFDKENYYLHSGSGLVDVKYGKSKGKGNRCWWCNNDGITLIPKTSIKEEEYVTKKEFEEFKKSIQNNQPIANKEEKPKDRVEKGQRYWFIDTAGNVSHCEDFYDKLDNYHYKVGNYYLIKEEVKRASEIQNILLKYSYNFTKEELEDINICKHYICINSKMNKLYIASNFAFISGERLFKKHEDCQRAIDEIGYDDYIKHCVMGGIK